MSWNTFVRALGEVSKSPRATTQKKNQKKGKCRSPQVPSVILKNLCSASVQPGGSQHPANDDHAVLDWESSAFTVPF